MAKDNATTSVGSLIRTGWEYLRNNINWLWQVGLLLALPTIVQSLILDPRTDLTEEEVADITSATELTESVLGISLAGLGALLLLWLVVVVVYNAIVYGGSIATLLDRLRGKKGENVTLSSLIASGAKHFWPVLLASIAVFAIIGVGTVLLVIPGLIAAFLLAFTLHYVVDQRLTVGEAMRASYETARDNVGTVFVTFLALFAVNFVVSVVAGIVFTPFEGRLQAFLTGLVGAAIATYSLIVFTKLYLAIKQEGGDGTSTRSNDEPEPAVSE